MSSQVAMFSSAMKQVKDTSAKLATKRNEKVLQDIAALQLHLQEQAVLDIVDKLITELQRIIARLPPGKLKLAHLWRMFHGYRQSELLIHWVKLGDIVVREIDPFTMQSVSEKLLVALLPQPEMTSTPSKLDRALTCDEERAVMYAGGYVVKTLLDLAWEDSAREALSRVQVLECLLEAGRWDEGGNSASFVAFIRDWIADLDRGGLKILNEHAFDFFKTVEIYHYITTEKIITPQAIGEKVAADDDILYISVDNVSSGQ